MRADPGLRLPVSKSIKYMLAHPDTMRPVTVGDPDTASGGRVRHVIVSLHEEMISDFDRLGWRYKELLHDAIMDRADHDRMPWGTPIRLNITEFSGWNHGLSDMYAEREDTIIHFQATLLAMSERLSVPFLVGTADGEVLMDHEYSAKEHGELVSYRNQDMQEIVLEDTSVRDRPRRINARLYGSAHVDTFMRGQKVEVKGIYRAEKKVTRGQATYTYWVEVIEAEAVEDLITGSWTQDEINLGLATIKDKGWRTFLDALADSVAVKVPGNRWPKMSCLLSAVGGARLDEAEPANIHTLMVGDPGTGKSAIMIDLINMLKRSTYGVAESMSARGMTYGMEEWHGQKMVSAGAMLLNRYVGVDEFMSFSPETLNGIKVVLSNQVATYNKTGFHLETPTDCTVIASGNPKGDVWDDEKSVPENMEPVPVAIITRMNVFRIRMQKDHTGRSEQIMEHFLGGESARPPISRERVAHWLEWAASRPDPELTREGASAIKSFFVSFWGVRQDPAVSAMIQARLEVNAYRNACGFARLLGDARMTERHAELAIELFCASMESLDVPVKNAAAGLGDQKLNKEAAFVRTIAALEEENHVRGFLVEDVNKRMVRDHAEHWPTADHAWAYIWHSERIGQHTHKPYGDSRLRKN